MMRQLPLRTPRRPYRRGARRAPWIPDVDRSTAIVDAAVYRSGCRHEGQLGWQDAVAAIAQDDSAFGWIGLHAPSENQLSGIAEAFQLHPLAVEDAVMAHQRPKLDSYDESLFVVVKTVHHQTGEANGSAGVVETGEIMIFLGANFVLTVRHGEHSALSQLRKRLEADPGHLALGPSVVLHAVLDMVVDEYLVVVSELQNDIDEAETSVFTGTNR